MEKEKKKKYYLLIGILTMIISITGATYAYFALTASNNNTISGTAATASLNLSVTKVKPTTEGTDKLVPQLETALGSAINSTNNCVDTIGNKVCQVYQITITNTGTGTATVQGKIAFTGIDNLPHLKWKLLSNATTIDSNQSATTASTTATNIGSSIQLAQNASSNLYFVVWIDEINGAQTDSGIFGATITFTDSNGQGLTSTIGATNNSSPSTPTVDTYLAYVNEGDGYIGMNETLPSYASSVSFPTAAQAMQALATRWILDSFPACLAVTLNNNIVEKQYVVFTITPEMVTANAQDHPGMTAGTYYLRGGVDESDDYDSTDLDKTPIYKSNLDVLKSAFGTNNCTGLDSSDAYCTVSGLHANASSYGSVYAYGDSHNCNVSSDGDSHCD